MSQLNTSRADEIKNEINSARSEVNGLAAKARLTSVHDEFASMETAVQNLTVRIRKIRDRKYAFIRILETQEVEFRRQLAQKRGNVNVQLNTESRMLVNSLAPLERRASTLHAAPNPGAAAKRLKEEADAFETRVRAVESVIRSTYDDLKREVDKVQAQLSTIEKTLEYSESASFGFLPGECVVQAVKAVWTRDATEDKGDPEGILFLTDQRLIFEQREEIATKKVLFVTTERQKVQQLQFELPVFSIASAKAEKQGVFKNEDWLELEFDHGSFARDSRLHLDGQNCEDWQKLIIQVKARELDTDRALALDEAAVEKARSAPEKCPYCGGAITKPVLRGMDSIICDYCGNRIRL